MIYQGKEFASLSFHPTALACRSNLQSKSGPSRRAITAQWPLSQAFKQELPIIGFFSRLLLLLIVVLGVRRATAAATGPTRHATTQVWPITQLGWRLYCFGP